MSLDVYIQPRREPPCRGGDFEVVTSFEDDGYYWFLFPLFEQLKRRTGQSIDLYGDATFSGSDLDELAQTVAEARRLVGSQPEKWDVSIGIQISPQRREVLSSVYKTQFLKLLLDLEAAADKARVQGLCVAFWGD